jgi:ribosome-binding factor A
MQDKYAQSEPYEPMPPDATVKDVTVECASTLEHARYYLSAAVLSGKDGDVEGLRRAVEYARTEIGRAMTTLEGSLNGVEVWK